MTSQRYCITAALLYANGPVHLGHLVEYIQADVLARFLRLTGCDVRYLCGNDAHGTPIMLAAEKQGIPPESLIEAVHQDHAQDLARFGVEFDHFTTTHSETNQRLVGEIYQRLKEAGALSRREISQAYDEEKSLFLPDRYVKGECPRCGAADQYGDNCEVCGASYAPTELRNPRSVLSGTTPTTRQTEHLFFELNNQREFLLDWLDSGSISSQCANKLKEWFEDDLRAWDISRDAPYFGFAIPGDENKFFYVWFDAPIGYMACDHELSARRGDDRAQADWEPGSETKLIHFIGKDILYFHALFWPAVLNQAGFRLPSQIQVHGYLTINGQKMSKSRGTFITAKQYADQLNPECLRYFYAAKQNGSNEDIDLNLEDFRQRVNSDLVGKFVNIASRCAGFITKHFDGLLSDELLDADQLNTFIAAGDVIESHYKTGDTAKAMREIMQLADMANQTIDREKPWVIAKEKPVSQEVQKIATQGINLFRLLCVYLKPVLPATIEKAEQFMNCDPLTWDNRNTALLGERINAFKPLLTRIAPEDIETLSGVIA